MSKSHQTTLLADVLDHSVAKWMYKTYARAKYTNKVMTSCNLNGEGVIVNPNYTIKKHYKRFVINGG